MSDTTGGNELPTTMPLVEAGGEALAAYLRRTFPQQTGKTFWGLKEGMPRLEPLPPVIRPWAFSLDQVQSFYSAASGLAKRVTDLDRYGQVLSHLWGRAHPRTYPLDVRMAETPSPELGDKLPDLDEPSEHERMVLWATNRFSSAKSRDLLVAQLFDALRQGALVMHGLVPTDHSRQGVAIAPGWWSDEEMVCAWTAGQLRPRDGAGPDLPTYRELRIFPAALAQPAQSEISRAVLRPPEEQPKDLQPRPPPQAVLEEWYRRERVAPWQPGLKIPSAKDDYKAAREEFGSEFRETIRRLRSELAPDEWHASKPGRKANGQ